MLTAWATMSWSSRAMRARSSATAMRATASDQEAAMAQGIPVGPVVLLVHVASVNVPFTSEAKAIPSFVRITGLTCNQCHVQFTPNPDLPDNVPDEAEADGRRDLGDSIRISGNIRVPCFLNAPGCPPGSEFNIGPDGLPQRIPGNTTVYDFTCNIPRRDGKLRPGLYGHGLFGGQGEIDQGQLKDLSFEHGFLFCAVDWNGMATKDVPNAVTVLQDVSRFPTLVDHVEQGYLGFLLLGRAMIHPDGLSSHPAFGDQRTEPALVIQRRRHPLRFRIRAFLGLLHDAHVEMRIDLLRGALRAVGLRRDERMAEEEIVLAHVLVVLHEVLGEALPALRHGHPGHVEVVLVQAPAGTEVQPAVGRLAALVRVDDFGGQPQ